MNSDADSREKNTVAGWESAMSEQKKSFGIYTLGCKVNQYESEAISEALCERGLQPLPPTEICDGYVINTCTVTAESDRKARQFIRRAIKRNPNAAVVVTGCLAQTSAEAIASMEGVDAVVGNAEKMKAAELLWEILTYGKRSAEPTVSVSEIECACFEPMSITAFGRTRAYVKIEDGCENRCTYCIIPDARGRVRSKPMGEVLCEVEALTAGGCREVVLTGIETASYGRDLGDTDLASLLQAVDSIEGIGRVRLGSLDPSLILRGFADRVGGLSSLCPHFHLSLQSGSSSVLARMKRKYNAAQAKRAMELLRAALPRVRFTTDVIVGFPGETEEEFMETVEFVREAGFLNVHIFPYSKRRGTPAAGMSGQVPEEEKRRRLHLLEQVVAEGRRRQLCEAIAGEPTVEVLFETYKDGNAVGHTDDFLEVSVRSQRALHGETGRVILKETDGELCYGELLSEEGANNGI